MIAQDVTTKPSASVTVASKKPEASNITVVLTGGKRFSFRKESSLNDAKAEAAAIAENGYATETEGVWTLYPAHLITKITVTASTD